MSEQPEREWKKYLLSKGVFGNALRFVHLEKPEEVDRTPSRRSAGREKQVVGKVFGLGATGKFVCVCVCKLNPYNIGKSFLLRSDCVYDTTHTPYCIQSSRC